MIGGVLDRLDEIGKPAWLGLMVISFILFWPAGLAVLFFLIWSGRMHSWKHQRMERFGWGCGQRRDYRNDDERQAERAGDRFRRWMGKAPDTGNRAFDEYRDETLRRLEEEQREFRTFLDRLRHAKDKAEFDQFMADRRGRPAQEPPHTPPADPAA
jgi:hypothetical protein